MNALFRAWLRHSAVLVCTLFVVGLVSDVHMDARGGSFGGSRGGGSRGGGSFGGSRGGSSFGSSRSGGSSFGSSRGGSSFGGSRNSSPNTYNSQSSPSVGSQSPSFGGSRSNIARGAQIGSSQEYTRSYGIPRRQETAPYTGSDGVSRNYVFNHYGGYADGLMTGYAMGRTSWWWYTPFHPAFYYSTPSYYVRPDGALEYYPPTFSFGTLFFVLIMGGVVVFVIYVIVRNRRSRRGGGMGDMSQSSFG